MGRGGVRVSGAGSAVGPRGGKPAVVDSGGASNRRGVGAAGGAGGAGRVGDGRGDDRLGSRRESRFAAARRWQCGAHWLGNLLGVGRRRFVGGAIGGHAAFGGRSGGDQ